MASSLARESAAYGYGALEEYVRELLDTARPGAVLDLPPRLRFVESFRARHPRHGGGQPRDAFRARLPPSQEERVLRGPDGRPKFAVYRSASPL